MANISFEQNDLLKVGFEDKGTLAARIQFAIEVYKNPRPLFKPYKKASREAALKFLQKTFTLPYDEKISSTQLSSFEKLILSNPNLSQMDINLSQKNNPIAPVPLLIEKKSRYFYDKFFGKTTAPLTLKEKVLMKEFNVEIYALNALIKIYNSQPNSINLNNLSNKRKEMHEKYSPQDLTVFPQYIHGFRGNFEDVLRIKKSLENGKPNDVAQQLQSLTRNEINILSKGLTMYKPGAQGFSQYTDDIRSVMGYDFFEKYTMERLSIRGNTINFKITDIKTKKRFLLKFESKICQLNDVANSLMNNKILQNVITTTYASNATLSNPSSKGERIETKNISLCEFCTGGNLEALSKESPDSDRAQLAVDLYSQMATILLEMQKENVAFPDMKNSNWLLDSSNKLRISDTKSLLFSENNRMEIARGKNKWHDFVRTGGLDVPEFDPNFNNDKPIDADKMHSMMLGKNLYEFLVQRPSNPGHEILDDNCFNYPIFATEEGKKFKNIIKQLIKKNPEERMSLKDALKEIKSIQLAAQPEHVIIQRELREEMHALRTKATTNQVFNPLLGGLSP